MKENFEKTVIRNGLRVVTERIPQFRSATIGIWVDAGSTDEDEATEGISHFLEHLLFKGTPSRTAKDIARLMDSIGGNLNAFTEKEQTCYYAKVMDKHVPVAVELLGDMLLHSHFPEEEVEREKGVILEEIKMYEDSPDELIFDLAAQAAWDGHPLGRPILGSSEAIRRITRGKLLDYVKRFYTPDKIVISIVGHVNHEHAVKLIERHVPFPAGAPNGKKRSTPAARFKTSRLIRRKDTEQVHLCLVLPGISQRDERRYALAVLDTVLGASASSRLFQEIREKLGLAYNISSFQGAYADSALFGIYGAVSRSNLQPLVNHLKRILGDIRENGITSKELKAAKEHLKGALSLMLESSSNRMIRLAKNELYFGQFIPHKEVLRKIQAVRMEDIRAVAREALALEQGAWAVLGPVPEEVCF